MRNATPRPTVTADRFDLRLDGDAPPGRGVEALAAALLAIAREQLARRAAPSPPKAKGGAA